LCIGLRAISILQNRLALVRAKFDRAGDVHVQPWRRPVKALTVEPLNREADVTS